MGSCCKRKKIADPNVFQPDFHRKGLTEKFYARHESLNVNSPSPNAIRRFRDEIEKMIAYGPKQMFSAPLTENQVYGWLHEHRFCYEGPYDTGMMTRPRRVDEPMLIQRAIYLEMNRNRRLNRTT